MAAAEGALTLPRRVTILLDDLLGGGAARVAAHLSWAWADQGWQVTLLTTDDGLLPAFFELHPKVVHCSLALRGDSRSALGAVVRNLRRLAVLRRAIRASGPDLLISFLDTNNVMCLLATRGMGRIPTLVSERTDPRGRPLGAGWQWLRRRTYPWADGLVTQSAHALAYFEPRVRAKGWVIPNPVLPLPAPSGPAAPHGPRHRVVTLGRLNRVKGHDLLIEAFAALAETFPDWDLVIHGEGPERDGLMARIQGHGLRHRIFLEGATDQPGARLREADLFVLPSRTEGFPNALAEAMACALPVVSFDCASGPAELIRDGVDGLLVPPEDVPALSRAMAGLMGSPPERARLAARAPEVLVRFSLDRVLGLWAEAIGRILPELDPDGPPDGPRNLTLVVNHLVDGGAARIAAYLSGAWADQGRNVTLMTTDGGMQPSFYALHPRVVHQSLDLRGDSGNPLAALGRNIGRVLRIRRAIRSSRPDLLVSFLDRNNIRCLLATRGMGRIPTLISERTDPHGRTLGRPWEGLRRLTYPWADCLVTQSRNAMAYFPSRVQIKGRVIPNPVYRPEAQSPVPKRGPRCRVITLGRLQRVKGHDLLIDAFARIAALHPDWDLCIHGDGPEHDGLQERIQAYELADRITLGPSIADVGSCLRDADLFVLPSRVEGFPNALAEAMAWGLPVISFDCASGPGELIRPGVDGILVPSGQVSAMAEAMHRLMADPDQRNRLAARAPDVLDRFSPIRVMGLWESAIESVCRTTSRRKRPCSMD
jgi:glycosyltransferase involved in cell wall biosynthesis